MKTLPFSPSNPPEISAEFLFCHVLPPPNPAARRIACGKTWRFKHQLKGEPAWLQINSCIWRATCKTYFYLTPNMVGLPNVFSLGTSLRAIFFLRIVPKQHRDTSGATSTGFSNETCKSIHHLQLIFPLKPLFKEIFMDFQLPYLITAG